MKALKHHDRLLGTINRDQSTHRTGNGRDDERPRRRLHAVCGQVASIGVERDVVHRMVIAARYHCGTPSPKVFHHQHNRIDDRLRLCDAKAATERVGHWVAREEVCLHVDDDQHIVRPDLLRVGRFDSTAEQLQVLFEEVAVLRDVA